LADHQLGLRRAVRSIRTRLAVPVGGKQGRVHGYATQAERYAKQRRLQHLEGELAKVEDRLSSARVSVCRGGHRLAKLRHRLDHVDVKLTEAEWQACWQARRWFLTADGDATKRWGNETIRVHPEQQWGSTPPSVDRGLAISRSGEVCHLTPQCNSSRRR